MQKLKHTAFPSAFAGQVSAGLLPASLRKRADLLVQVQSTSAKSSSLATQALNSVCTDDLPDATVQSEGHQMSEGLRQRRQ